MAGPSAAPATQMIFCDSSAIYALADPQDLNHTQARRLLSSALESREHFVIHNYVVAEALTLLQRRLGHAAAVLFARSASAFELVWVDEDVHRAALKRFLERGRRQVSFVDEVSFVVMSSRGIEVAFCFDPDFEREGFRRLRTASP